MSRLTQSEKQRQYHIQSQKESVELLGIGSAYKQCLKSKAIDNNHSYHCVAVSKAFILTAFCLDNDPES